MSVHKRKEKKNDCAKIYTISREWLREMGGGRGREREREHPRSNTGLSLIFSQLLSHKHDTEAVQHSLFAGWSCVKIFRITAIRTWTISFFQTLTPKHIVH